MKTILAKDINKDENVETTLMLMKKLSKENGKLIAFLGDKSGDIKTNLSHEADDFEIGAVLWVKGQNSNIFEVSEFKKIDEFELEDYLPAVKKPIEDIMKELEDISKEEFKTREAMELNNYFFKNEEFLQKFKKGIGGLKQHHNYLGGLAEHSLNVMYMSKLMAYRYDCRNKEIAILAAKLHDIGKIEEYFVDGPFSVTLRGNMEGHIVIGMSMIEEAFRLGGEIYSEDFKQRLRGCVVQHHGKPEFGSPKATNTEEAFIVHYADYIDATMNKVIQVKEITAPNTWSEYDRRIGTRLYV